MLPRRSHARRRRESLLAAASLAALVALPRSSSAEEPPKEAPLEPDAGTPRPPPPDGRTGHLLLYPRVSFTGGAGSLASLDPTASVTRSTATGDVVGGGLGLGGVVGIGIGRYASLQLDGGYTLFSNPNGCDNCKGTSVDVGLGLTYHVAQGIAVDPWGSFGMGVRSQSYSVLQRRTDDPKSTDLLKQSYFGFDFARIALGADFYPHPVVGFGPYFEADVGTNLARPADTYGASVYAFFQVGLRLAFDPFRKAPARASTTARRD